MNYTMSIKTKFFPDMKAICFPIPFGLTFIFFFKMINFLPYKITTISPKIMKYYGRFSFVLIFIWHYKFDEWNLYINLLQGMISYSTLFQYTIYHLYKIGFLRIYFSFSLLMTSSFLKYFFFAILTFFTHSTNKLVNCVFA